MLEAEHQDVFDSITRLIALICDVPVALIHLVEEYQMLLKFRARAYAEKFPGEAAFCSPDFLQDDMMVVPDTLNDERFADNPLVTGEPKIRFYAGVPLMLTSKVRLGSLCVIDHRPRVLDSRQVELLRLLASHAVSIITLLLDESLSMKEYSSLVMVKQRLQFQKDLTEAFIDNAPESVMIVSRLGELEQINRAGLDMLEARSLDDARKKRLVDYVLPEFHERFSEFMTRVFLGSHAVAEYKIRGIKGSEYWLESHAAPLYNRQGEIINLIAITRDVTDIKQSQQDLTLAARVFTEAREGMIITDASSTILDVNPAFCQITGYSPEEVIGKTPKILQSGVQGPDFYTALWKTLTETGHWKGEIWSRKKNGELYAELLSINALPNAAGAPINYVALFFDITEYKKQHGEAPAA